MNFGDIFEALLNPRVVLLFFGALLVYDGVRAVRDESASFRSWLTLGRDVYGKKAVAWGWFWITLGGLLLIAALLAVEPENTVFWQLFMK